MARRILLMCALMEQPRLIIADEPTPGLDLDLAVRAVDDFRAFADSGGAVLLITHDLELAMRVADRIAVCKDGSIIEETSAGKFLTPSLLRHPFTRALACARPSCPDGPWGREPFRSSEAEDLQIASTVTRARNDAILTVSDLTFGYSDGPMLYQGFHLTLRSGMRLALEGRSGCGKTTLCRLLAGYLQPRSGILEIDGIALSTYQVAGSVRPIQLINQHPECAFDPHMRMRASLAEAGSPDAPDAVRLRERFGVRDEWLARFPHELSGGELMRFCLVRALMVKPRVLICDESTAMLDLVTQVELWRSICDLQADMGFALLFTSHDPELVRCVATHYLLLERAAGDLNAF